jgi:hypothetical protein
VSILAVIAAALSSASVTLTVATTGTVVAAVVAAVAGGCIALGLKTETDAPTHFVDLRHHHLHHIPHHQCFATRA